MRLHTWIFVKFPKLSYVQRFYFAVFRRWHTTWAQPIELQQCACTRHSMYITIYISIHFYFSFFLHGCSMTYTDLQRFVICQWKDVQRGPGSVGPRFSTWRLSNLQASGVQLNSVPIDVQVFPQGVHKPSTVSWMGDTCGYHEQLSINNDKRIQEINRSWWSDILQPLDISIDTMFYTSYQNIWDHRLPRGSTTKNLHRPRRCSFSSRMYQW